MKPFRILKSGALGLLAVLPLTLAAELPSSVMIERQTDRPEVSRNLEVKLESLDWYAKDEPLKLRFTISNPTSESIWILDWQLPSDDMSANLLRITRNGEPVKYLGRRVKRGAPRAEDYIEIKPYESRTIDFDPSAFYDMGEQGTYFFQLHSNRVSIRTARPESRKDLESIAILRDRENRLANLDTRPTHSAELTGTTSVQLWFEGVPGYVRAEDSQLLAPSGLQSVAPIGSYVGCTSARQTIISAAHSKAASIAADAKAMQTNNPNGTLYYQYWFGTFDSTRYRTVTGNFTNISSSLNGANSYTYDCSTCTNSGWYAYVDGTARKIYLCALFWTAPSGKAKDSQPGTIVHETSHLVASTSDYAYGVTDCRALASSDPGKAVKNADNNEYFAEDIW